MRKSVAVILIAVLISTGFALLSLKAEGEQPLVVRACDGRKMVIVEGMSKGEIMPREKAARVASLLMDLSRYCEERITLRVTREDRLQVVSASMNLDVGNAGGTYNGKGRILLAHGKPHSQREKKIWEMGLKRVIDAGYKLFHDPALGTNGISCDMCHPDASNTHPETYPKFQTQLKKVALLRDMINWCIENPLEGKKLADDDAKMKALEAYILSTRDGKVLSPGKH